MWLCYYWPVVTAGCFLLCIQSRSLCAMLDVMSQFVGQFLSKLHEKLTEPKAKEHQMKNKQPSALRKKEAVIQGVLKKKTKYQIHCLFNDPTYPPTWMPVSTYSSRPSHLEICGLQRYIGYLAGKLWNRFFFCMLGLAENLAGLPHSPKWFVCKSFLYVYN